VQRCEPVEVWCKMPPISAGVLVYRQRQGCLEVLLVHPGGPYFRRRDEGVWSLPKGLVEQGEADREAARRELEEETGFVVAASALSDLGEVRQKGGKIVRAWAVEGDFDPDRLESNTFELEFPPRSGRRRRFPEVDRAAYFDLDTARVKILAAQAPLLDRLVKLLEQSSVRSVGEC